MVGVDKNFWLEYAEEGIKESRDSRDKAAISLDSFLKWLWGIYTSVFALASFLNYLSSDITQLLMIAQPILIIILARFFCTLVSMPGAAVADPNVVSEIKEAHKDIISRKRRRLRNAIIATIVSIISLCFALVGYNRFDPNQKIKSEIKQLELAKKRSDYTQSQILITIDSLKQINQLYELRVKNVQLKEQYNTLEENGTE